jgi:hypothetical protein
MPLPRIIEKIHKRQSVIAEPKEDYKMSNSRWKMAIDSTVVGGLTSLIASLISFCSPDQGSFSPWVIVIFALLLGALVGSIVGGLFRVDVRRNKAKSGLFIGITIGIVLASLSTTVVVGLGGEVVLFNLFLPFIILTIVFGALGAIVAAIYSNFVTE